MNFTTENNLSIKLLLDTGANKNIIKPGVLPDVIEVKNASVKNITGNHQVHRKGKLEFSDANIPPQMFYELKFHNYFDGILGSEFFAQNRARIDFAEENLVINKTIIPFQKYFIKNKIFNHTLEIETTKDGDWFVPTFQKLTNNMIVEPGLYKSSGKTSTIRILSTSKERPKLSQTVDIKINNFELLTPIPLKTTDRLNKNEIEKLIRTDHLTQIEKQNLLDVILRNQAVLLKTDEKLSATTAIKHKIVTKDEEPTYTKSYRYPHHFKKDIEDQIQEMLENGIIQHSSSPYSSPIWVVPKKKDASGIRKVRVVIDYRKLNEKTVDDKYPIPQIEEILDNLGKSVYFTTLDLKSGFHQIEMDPKHRNKTAFSTALGHFEFTRMPFGLKNAPATFQRAMNNILGDYIGKICYVYLDDIIIIGFNLENHMENLSKILQRLSDFNLKIQLDKCEFLKRETEFLGHVITPDGIKPNPDKIKKILEWSLPKSPKEIKQFLGLTGYYRKFIKDYSKITKPMTRYLKKDAKVDVSNSDYIKAFNELKEIITSDQILAYPDFNLPFILTTDASNYALGAVLSQIQNGIEKPIAFGSRTLNKTEANYSTTEKEALAIMWAIDKYKPYLYGNKFLLITDHKPLTFIKSSFKNSKILRWRLELENFDYEVKYKEGKTNVVADALSREPNEINCNVMDINSSPILDVEEQVQEGNENENEDDESEDAHEDVAIENQPEGEEIQPMDEGNDLETIHSADDSGDHFIHFTDRPINYFKNQLIFRIASFTSILQENPFPHFKRTTIVQPDYNINEITDFLKKFHDGRQTVIMAPESLLQQIQESFKENFSEKGHFVLTQNRVEDVANEERQNMLIAKEHERAHRGITEVEAQLRRSYFFPRMSKIISNHINTCPHCNSHKYERKPYNIKISPRPVTEKPLDRVHMDIFIINNYKFLSLVDSFSKHLQMLYIKSKNLPHIQNALSKYFTSFGAPKTIITDHETTFRSTQLRTFLGTFGTVLEFASSSESNGQVERTHSTIVEIFNSNKYKFPGMQTKSIVKLAVSLYNDSVHSSTKFKPNEIIFNQNNIQNPIDVIAQAQKIFLETKNNILKAQTRQIKNNNAKEDPPILNEGQEVFVKQMTRRKTQARAIKTNVNNVQEKTFKNRKGTKRHKNKINRLKKRH